MDESATTTGAPSQNSPTGTYMPSAQRDDRGGSALASTLNRNKDEAYRPLFKNKTNFDTQRRDSMERDELARQMHRRWTGGDVYAPHDLSYQEQKQWKKPRQPNKDVIDMLGLNPLDHYKVR